ncbi:uncharacterized protein TM35_000191020 [Trypanosoma theileri]|uniref:Uncharacterized protein n=1 Tax=Trypanosoma theileri TaxID=67003 RepID=A0A1X0NTJ5_9TRYP|nr:uncharacterized protein TM35_000191020 [Trypanosoma theileri]ORC87858.1 hypothetical protein TM35_000191020 [Trypanosoma theileri]
MNHLLDSDDNVQGGPSVKPAAKEPLVGWQPPPSPWGEESVPIAANTVKVGEAGVHIPTSEVIAPSSLQANKSEGPLLSFLSSEEVAPAKATLVKPQSCTTQQEHEFNYAQQNHSSHVSNIKPLITLTEEVTVALPELPPPPEQKIPHQDNLPKIKDLPHPKTGVMIESSFCKDDQSSWGSFLELKKNTEESVSRMKCFYDQVVKLQLTHEQEAASYRDTSEGIINQQRKQLDVLASDYKDALSNNESLKSLLEKKSLELMEYQKINYDLNIRLRDSEQRRAHLEDRALIAENGRNILEIRLRELEMLLEHTTQVVNGLRERLNSYDKDRERILHEQREAYEENRRDIINFYNERENLMLRNFNDSVRKLREAMNDTIKVREERLSKTWSDIICDYQKRHDSIVKELGILRENEEKEYRAKIACIEQDKERWYDQYRKEMDLLEERHKEREKHLLTDIERRERELGEREQRMRLLRLQEEQEAKVALLAKESELKAYYQKITEEIRTSFEKEREKLSASFREQIQDLSQLHLNNERELERLHREKEREMAQRYRVAGYEVDDRKGDLDLRGVSLQTQSSLLSKLDAIETRQRERAEKTRAAFQNSIQ